MSEHLTGKFRYSEEEAQEAVNLLRSQMEKVEPGELDAPVCRDPDDDLVLATAVAGGVRCIVTGDKDLLVLERYRGIEIVSPSSFAEFEARIGET